MTPAWNSGPWTSCLGRLATTPAKARALIADAVAILEARAGYLAGTGQRVWAPSTEMPALIIIIGEYAELVESAPEATEDADSIARRGRAVAVTLIAATQRPTQKAMGQGVLLLGHGGRELVDGALAVDMEGDFHHPRFRERAGLTSWTPVAEGLGGDVVDGEAPRGGLPEDVPQDATTVGVADPQRRHGGGRPGQPPGYRREGHGPRAAPADLGDQGPGKRLQRRGH